MPAVGAGVYIRIIGVCLCTPIPDRRLRRDYRHGIDRISPDWDVDRSRLAELVYHRTADQSRSNPMTAMEMTAHVTMAMSGACMCTCRYD